jgi:hypothetical protein
MHLIRHRILKYVLLKYGSYLHVVPCGATKAKKKENKTDFREEYSILRLLLEKSLCHIQTKYDKSRNSYFLFSAFSEKTWK